MEETAAALAEYARVPAAVRVESILHVAAPAGGLGGLVLTERRVEAPYTKDYDALPGEGPLRWADRFDLSGWGWLAARTAGRRVGCAAVTFDAAALDPAVRRPGLAVLWDVRVAPEARGRGVGSALFRAAVAWAAARGGRQLVAETQNINVPACRFYARQGCVLGAIDRFAYRELPDEVRLLWFRNLSAHG